MKKILICLSLGVALLLAACGAQEETPEEGPVEGSNQNGDNEMDHADMDHSSSGEVPEGLEEAENPVYEVGSKAIITEAHMPGMEDVEATVVGAYNTVVYTVSYTPTDGGERVEDHKWVIHEEIEEAGDEPFQPGDEVTLNASHMEGMNGATAEIDSVEQTTVYMVDFTTKDGEEIKNHKWVVESELAPIE
ncbi:DUF1541 domain-containing protein [Gracilibacillus salitolerans]|uniref:DUF1541 domain-containing protein n=1 Tax=Gracilibacillus salitolerans TaxID=2663022 RepID=UPI0038992AA0